MHLVLRNNEKADIRRSLLGLWTRISTAYYTTTQVLHLSPQGSLGSWTLGQWTVDTLGLGFPRLLSKLQVCHISIISQKPCENLQISINLGGSSKFFQYLRFECFSTIWGSWYVFQWLWIVKYYNNILNLKKCKILQTFCEFLKILRFL